jgi:predicted PurR-regulated permease PerM
MYSKRATIIFLSVLILIVLGFAFVITQSFLRPFAFAIILAVVFHPLHERILQSKKFKPGTASLLSTLLLLFLFGVPGVIIATLAANEALAAAHYLGRRSAEEGGFTLFLMNMADRPLHMVGRWVDLTKYDIHGMISADVQKVSLWMFGFGGAVLSNLARFITDALITFVVVFFLFRDGKDWAYRAGTFMPLSPQQVGRLYRDISDTIVANVYGILSVGAAQGILTGIALRIIGMPSALLLGLAAAFASVIPVIGAALIWAPVGIYLLVTGAVWKGVFLLLWGTLVISSVDNIIRPWVVSGRVELHPLVLLFFIFGGVEAFGFIGLFLGPVIASVLAALFDILRGELSQNKVTPAAVANGSP